MSWLPLIIIGIIVLAGLDMRISKIEQRVRDLEAR